MCVDVWVHSSVILQKISPLPLAVEQQLLSELLQLLVAVHQERRVIPADRLRAADTGGVRWERLNTDTRKGKKKTLINIITSQGNHYLVDITKFSSNSGWWSHQASCLFKLSISFLGATTVVKTHHRQIRKLSHSSNKVHVSSGIILH